MVTKKTPLIIGNWKMNPQTETAATNLAKAVVKETKKFTDAKVVVTPPSLYIPAVSKALAKSTVSLAAQHIHPGPIGAFTGEISPIMCAPYGVSYVIAGHSERRAKGETDEMVKDQVAAILKNKLTPVLCVGERQRDPQANFYTLIETQITSALAGIPKNRYKDIVIAYEPVWAIGTGLNATPADVQEMKLFIIKVLTKLAGRSCASAVTILYGGSVKGETAAALYHEGDVDGFLVGGASLVAEEFTKIIKSTLSK